MSLWRRALVLWQMVNVWKDWSQEGRPFAGKWRSKGSEVEMHTVWLRYYLIDRKYSQQQTFMGSLACVWGVELRGGIQRLEMRKMRKVLLKWVAEKLEKDQLPYFWGSWGGYLYTDHLVWYIRTTYHIWTDIHSWTDYAKKWLDYKTKKNQLRSYLPLVPPHLYFFLRNWDGNGYTKWQMQLYR